MRKIAARPDRPRTGSAKTVGPMQQAQPRPAALHGGLRMCTTTKTPLVRAPVPMVRRLVQIATAIWAEACAGESLSHLEFGILGALRMDSPLDQISLAGRIGVDRTNIGLIIDGLEKRGLVERTVNPHDRRARCVQVTADGMAVHAIQAPKTAIAREKILSPLTAEEREMFYDLLEKVIAANEQYSIPGAGRRKRNL